MQGRYNVLFPCTGNSARSIKVGAVSFFETIPLRFSWVGWFPLRPSRRR
jgi:hypothetical protein